MSQALWDNLFNLCAVALWTLLLFYFFLVIGGIIYFRKNSKAAPSQPLREYPMVSVIVPAHNEAMVIRKTIETLLNFDYPQNRYEIIVINDNSSDNSAEILSKIQQEHPGRNLTVIHTDSTNGGKGKSNALNLAMGYVSGSLISIYDADNTPEPDALRLLADALMADDQLSAAVGMFRTRNKNASLLTRCINIETLSTQCTNHAGRCQFFKLGMLTGTNYMIRRSVIEALGGWETDSITEDTELSYRMHSRGYRIQYIPRAVSWQQEPQDLKIWFKQRARWVRGNFQVFTRYFHCLFDSRSKQLRFEILQYMLMIFITTVVCGLCNIVSLLSLFGVLQLTTPLATIWNWIAISIIFVSVMYLGTIHASKETNWGNLFASVLMIGYSFLWYPLIFYSICQSIRRRITGQTAKWDKTVRFEEKNQDSRKETPV